jgi:hypothetical protein
MKYDDDPKMEYMSTSSSGVYLNYARYVRYHDSLSHDYCPTTKLLSNALFIKRYGNEINWNDILAYRHLSSDFIEQHIDAFAENKWRVMSKKQKLTEAFMRKHINLLYPNRIIKHQTLSEPFIEEYIDRFDMYDIIAYQKLSEAFLEKHYHQITHKSLILSYQDVSEAFLEKHISDIAYYWNLLALRQKLSITFIEKHKDKLMKSSTLSLNKFITEDIIELYPDMFDIKHVLCNQKVSEAFIEKHANDINWNEVIEYQTLSLPFIIKHYDKFNHNVITRAIMMNKMKFPERIIKKHIVIGNSGVVFKYQKLSDGFIDKFLCGVNTPDTRALLFIASRYQTLSISFIEKHIADLYMKRVYRYQILTKEFIKAHGYMASIKKNKVITWSYAFIKETGIPHDLCLTAELREIDRYRDIKIRIIEQKSN